MRSNPLDLICLLIHPEHSIAASKDLVSLSPRVLVISLDVKITNQQCTVISSSILVVKLLDLYS